MVRLKKKYYFEERNNVQLMPVEEEIEQEEFHDEDEDHTNYLFAETIEEEETLSLEAKELEMIKKALEKTKGKRKSGCR